MSTGASPAMLTVSCISLLLSRLLSERISRPGVPSRYSLTAAATARSRRTRRSAATRTLLELEQSHRMSVRHGHAGIRRFQIEPARGFRFLNAHRHAFSAAALD